MEKIINTEANKKNLRGILSNETIRIKKNKIATCSFIIRLKYGRAKSKITKIEVIKIIICRFDKIICLILNIFIFGI